MPAGVQCRRMRVNWNTLAAVIGAAGVTRSGTWPVLTGPTIAGKRIDAAGTVRMRTDARKRAGINGSVESKGQ